jgi:hypothetical protein
VHWHRAAATAAAAHSSLYGAQGQLGAQGRLHTNTRDFPLLLPPIAGLFPGVMKDIEGEMNSLRLDPDESISLGLTMALIGNLVTTVGLNVQRCVCPSLVAQTAIAAMIGWQADMRGVGSTVMCIPSRQIRTCRTPLPGCGGSVSC